jgi:hypothetical protein
MIHVFSALLHIVPLGGVTKQRDEKLGLPKLTKLCRLIGGDGPTSGNFDDAQGVFGVFSYYQSIMLFLNMVLNMPLSFHPVKFS